MSDAEGVHKLVEVQRPDGSWCRAGTLSFARQRTTFTLHDSYWIDPNRVTLGQIFEEHPQTSFTSRTAVPNWFSHLLPEGRMKAAVAAELRINPSNEAPLLFSLGQTDLIGGVRIQSDSTAISRASVVEYEQQHSPIDSAILKFSLAGLQLKFSVIKYGRSFTMPVLGEAGKYILKTPGVHPREARVPRLEHAAMQFAAHIGIAVAESHLIQMADTDGLPEWVPKAGEGLLVERFDRHGPVRLHAEQFAQILDAPNTEAGKYKRANFETVASLTSSLCGHEDALEVLRRIVFFALIGNGDAHLKNWSVIYPDGRSPRLSPAYDIVPTRLLVQDDDLGLNLNGSKSFADVGRTSFRRLGSYTQIGDANARKLAADFATTVKCERRFLEDFLTHEEFEEISYLILHGTSL